MAIFLTLYEKEQRDRVGAKTSKKVIEREREPEREKEREREIERKRERYI